MALAEKLKDIEKLRKELKASEKNIAKDIMAELKTIMTENPQIQAFRWIQYTPHFNDGDSCTFGIYGSSIKLDETICPPKEGTDGEIDYGGDMSDGFLDDYQLNKDFWAGKADILNFKQIKQLEKTVKNVNKLFDHLSGMLDELEQTFGDGVQVTVTAKGVEVEDYDHD